jgi:hypothetical protein
MPSVGPGRGHFADKTRSVGIYNGHFVRKTRSVGRGRGHFVSKIRSPRADKVRFWAKKGIFPFACPISHLIRS